MFKTYYSFGALACQEAPQAIKLSFANSNLEDPKQKEKAYDEKICISHKESGKWVNEFYSPDMLCKTINHISMAKEHAYYIASQPLKGNAQTRRESNMFSYRNIVIDVDAHDYLERNNLSPMQLQPHVDELLHRINRDMQELPFNFAVETGRGVQLWMCMEETSKALKFAHSRAVNTLCKIVSDILKEYDLDDVFEVDKVSSKKNLSLFRLPGSYNPTTRTFTKVHIYHEELHDYNELNQTITDVWELFWNEEQGKSKKKKTRKITPITRAAEEYLPLMNKRVRIIEEMVERGMIDVGHREVAMFLYFNAARQLSWDNETPEDKTERLNKKLKKPISAAELKAIFNNRKVYKISNNLWYEYLDIKPSDVEGLVMTKSNALRDLKRKQKKDTRNEAIESYYKKDMPIATIAKTMGIGRATVQRVLDARGLRVTKMI